ncbi:MAG: hypothetical protein K9N46_01830 [Candidatus Marinimicrobia bacterium]|nr:hypothetical protein [Candidatus Neomarinimicrobiota bacterium]MCF7827783.1 hypothetical protein [Candidatus Neomarinimicrobiota bacterium]MCF7879462.1 hypothetical protein [Candidatus Neomarinimicrobiota bacterium]
MKYLYAFPVILVLCCLTVTATGQTTAADTIPSDSLNPQGIYENLLRSAFRDGSIDENERYLLRTLQSSLHLPDNLVTRLENDIIRNQPDRLDQSGRWPVVLQNIAIGSGLYGWTIPFVLDAENPKWYVGTEMLSIGGAFYLTYQYTKNMNIPYSRAQMMRGGSVLGLRYGYLVNDVFELWPSEVDLFTNSSKGWAVSLMASVPAGIWAGDYLYKQWKPSHGHSWALSLWGELGGYASRNLHRISAGTEDKPEQWEYEEYNPWSGQYIFHEQEYNQALQKYQEWKRTDALMEMAGYPLGIYLGHRYFGDRNYTFGDALMLYEGRLLGLMYAGLLSEIADIDLESSLSLTMRTVGSLGGAFLMDRYISKDDYQFGEAVLMALGTGSGMAFSLGTAALTSINDGKVISAMVMAGGAGGFFLTRSILDVSRDGTYSTLESRKSFDVIPSFSVVPVRDENNRTAFLSMIQAEIRF